MWNNKHTVNIYVTEYIGTYLFLLYTLTEAWEKNTGFTSVGLTLPLVASESTRAIKKTMGVGFP